MITKEVREKLELTTDGELKVVFLEVGSVFALNNYQTNFFIVNR